MPGERLPPELLEEAVTKVAARLSNADRSALRSSSSALRKAANNVAASLAFSSRAAYHGVASSHVFKRFPALRGMELGLSSASEVKAVCLLLLTDPGSSRLSQLVLSENRAAVQQQQAQLGRESEGRFSHYASDRSGASTSALTTDATEALLAAVCSCSGLRSLSVDKTSLLETEAAAIARMTSLEELRLTTNSSAHPLRKPLLQLMLLGPRNLRELKLCYIRDTTGELAGILARLPLLVKLTLQYAYWGESGAGSLVAASLAKHQRNLEELRLVECCTSDESLHALMSLTSLRRLQIQDEDAPEETCPSNKGLVRITQLKQLEHLELFGEELQLDTELLLLLSRLPALQYLAVAGLEALRADNVDLGALGIEAGLGQGLNLKPPTLATPGPSEQTEDEPEPSSTMGDGEQETDSSHSCVSMDDVTSRPRHMLHARHAARPGLAGSSGAGSGAGSGPGARAQQARGAAGGSGAVSSEAATAVPLHVLPVLDTLRLYGPTSVSQAQPPLALLLPQPGLKHIKLSACASHANMRALRRQPGLRKLIVSHTSTSQLYPPNAQRAAAAFPHLALSSDAQLVLEEGGQDSQQALPAPARQLPCSILGAHADVAAGLSQLVVLRLKDLPGFRDLHLADLATALRGLPALRELKLRALSLVSDGGVAALAGVQQLRRLKLYALGDGVSELGVAHTCAELPALEELKVKDCRRVGPSLRDTLAACRAMRQQQAHAAQQGQQQGRGQGGALGFVVVRCGADECDKGRIPSRKRAQ